MRDDVLIHAGKKGMKWGYNDGHRNGKTTAETMDPKEVLRRKAQNQFLSDRQRNVNRSRQQSEASRDFQKGMRMVKRGASNYAKAEVGRVTDRAKRISREVSDYSRKRDAEIQNERQSQLRRAEKTKKINAEREAQNKEALEKSRKAGKKAVSDAKKKVKKMRDIPEKTVKRGKKRLAKYLRKKAKELED